MAKSCLLPGVRREHGQVVFVGLNGLTRGIVAGWENSAPSQGDFFAPGRSLKPRDVSCIVINGTAGLARPKRDTVLVPSPIRNYPSRR